LPITCSTESAISASERIRFPADEILGWKERVQQLPVLLRTSRLLTSGVHPVKEEIVCLNVV
jgi:hypothetical protein